MLVQSRMPDRRAVGNADPVHIRICRGPSQSGRLRQTPGAARRSACRKARACPRARSSPGSRARIAPRRFAKATFLERNRPHTPDGGEAGRHSGDRRGATAVAIPRSRTNLEMACRDTPRRRPYAALVINIMASTSVTVRYVRCCSPTRGKPYAPGRIARRTGRCQHWFGPHADGISRGVATSARRRREGPDLEGRGRWPAQQSGHRAHRAQLLRRADVLRRAAATSPQLLT